MEKAEREFLVRYLASSRERLLETVEALDKSQQRFRPAPKRWSVAHCVEHVTIVEKAVLKDVQATVLSPPRTPHTPRDRSEQDQEILTAVPTRLPRCAAPPESLPGKRWTDFGVLLRQFEAARERTLRFVAVTQSDLRSHFFAHPQLGELDCYQWLLFLGAHSDRHARQAGEVIASPRFPQAADSAGA